MYGSSIIQCHPHTAQEACIIINAAYEVRPHKDKCGVDLISNALPFGRLWYETPANAIGYAMHSSRSLDAVIRVYDAAAWLQRRVRK